MTDTIPQEIWLDLTQVRMGYTSDPDTVEPGDVAFVPRARLDGAQDQIDRLETALAQMQRALAADVAAAERRGIRRGLEVAIAISEFLSATRDLPGALSSIANALDATGKEAGQ